jgi:BirA family biotin operon repressor/biotin-[acetyl-CoA-carboxylase] ligase
MAPRAAVNRFGLGLFGGELMLDGNTPSDRLLSRIAELLIRYPTVVVSGERIAGELGVTRSTVWRGVQQLRRLGVAVRGHPNSGYQLETVPDLLLPSLLASDARSGSLGHRIHHCFRVGSTQTLALAAAARGEPHGTLFVAEEQTRGRGRQNRQWQSPPSAGIACSLILRPPCPPAAILPLGLAAALAVADTVQCVTHLAADIRWPNDLLLQEKKFCGILLEISAEATRIQHAVLGIGINVNQTEFDGELAGIATSLRMQSGAPVSRVHLLSELLRELNCRYEQFLAGGSGEVLLEFERRSSYARNKHVCVGTGNEAYTGITQGLDALGFLRVLRDDDRGVTTVFSGDVRPV